MQHHDRHEGDDGRALAADDRLVERAADAGHVEDALGDGRADHQRAEVGAEVGDDGDERVAQDVHGDDAVAREALAVAVRTKSGV